mmetsp:Transcript_53894/g.153681  ORF Transcript_53894/g.153681 Transcript_53894/m.153681 type:complete len:286 (-) Transcript_53894:1188-2045(-)
MVRHRLQLHDLVRDVSPFALPAALRRESDHRVSAIGWLEPLAPAHGLHHKSNASDDWHANVFASIFPHVGLHGEVQAPQLLVHLLQRNLARPAVHFGDARGPLHALEVLWARPLPRLRFGQHAEVQHGLPQPWVQPGAHLHVCRSAAVGRCARDVQMTAVALEVKRVERHIRLGLASRAAFQEGFPVLCGYCCLCRGSLLGLLLESVPLEVPWHFKLEVAVAVLQPAVDRPIVQDEHEELVYLSRRQVEGALALTLVDSVERHALGRLPLSGLTGRAVLEHEVAV